METLKSGEGISAPAQDLIVHLLGLLMRDWGGEISYYVYDLDFGRKFEPGLLSDRDGYVDLAVIRPSTGIWRAQDFKRSDICDSAQIVVREILTKILNNGNFCEIWLHYREKHDISVLR